MTAVWFSLLSVFSTSAGGLCAWSLHDRLDRVLAFTAGALIGVVGFDLLPEIFALTVQEGGDGSAALAALVCGFLLLHGLQRRFGGRGHSHHDHDSGTLYAAAMIGHSVVDGIGIGLAFQVSDAVGFSVAAAIFAHDFCDGLGTVGVMLVHRSSNTAVRRMLVANAVAPVIGAASTVGLSVPPGVLAVFLGFFAGVLLHICVGDVLPRAYAQARACASVMLMLFTTLGAGLTYVVRLATA